MQLQTQNAQDSMTTPAQSDIGFHALAALTWSEFVFLYHIRSGRIDYSSESMGAVLGYPQNEPILKGGPLSLMQQEDAQGVMGDITTAAGRLVPVPSRTVRFLNGKGTVSKFRLFYCIRPTANAEETMPEWQVVVRCSSDDDLQANERDEVRRLRRESESILQFGTFDYDILNDAGHWSDGLYALFGYHQDNRPVVSYELLQRHVSGELRQEPVQSNPANPSGPREYTVDYPVSDVEGRQKTFRVTGRILYDKLGIAVRDIGLMMDITNHRSQLTTISNYIDELKRSNRGLEEFAYVASHDLQEPLRKISTFSGRLSARCGTSLDKEGAVYLDRIIAAADSMRHLMDNLLEFSKLSTINQQMSPTNLSFIVQQVRQDLELRIDETGTKILCEKLPVVEAAPTQMKQLFTNIINNAIKFAKRDVPPQIQISCTQEFTREEKLDYGLLDELNYYCITIQDNGIGFEKEYADRIFQIFQRLHGKSEYPGSGIGLAICRKIVEGHRGLIFADSIADQGARFTIILPEKQP